MEFAAELSLFYGDIDALRKKERAIHEDGCRRYLGSAITGTASRPLRKKGG
jgi:hypothetical protein